MSTETFQTDCHSAAVREKREGGGEMGIEAWGAKNEKFQMMLQGHKSFEKKIVGNCVS